MLGWPTRCKLARAFLWKYSYFGLKLAWLLGQLAVRFSLCHRQLCHCHCPTPGMTEPGVHHREPERISTEINPCHPRCLRVHIMKADRAKNKYTTTCTATLPRPARWGARVGKELGATFSHRTATQPAATRPAASASDTTGPGSERPLAAASSASAEAVSSSLAVGESLSLSADIHLNGLNNRNDRIYP